ncbi:SurA N-terminal domain-containing protein [Cohnella abietis]|uniref:Peptidylprolyl isomerase n=1 Tax=Cohnella abietis TaxID=2507935 RepID=A0A3T1D2R7_9BACL|nr:SurA N-terminal domain-containing protein [Cohnella abietis]BBI32403.1 hypothetical protein KCTCHS21_18020 [Cohnella abietis]
MIKKLKYLSIVAIIIAVTATVATSVFASSPISIDSLFSGMKANLSKPGDLPDGNVIAKVGSKEITYKEFRENSENVKMFEKKAGASLNRSNNDILNDMIKKQLTVQYAIEKGIVVSDEEVQSYANEQREALQTVSEEAKEALKNLINISGLSENEYWKSDVLLSKYRNWIIINKLIESDNSLYTLEAFNSFQESLLKNSSQNVDIDQQNFAAIK